MKIIVANFKSHQTNAETEWWCKIFQDEYQSKEDVKVILAPSFINIPRFVREMEDLGGVAIGSQDVSSFPPGAYTGAINAKQLIDLGVKYAIVGHSERRKWFHETHQEIANKIQELLEQKITPILCMDKDYLNAQIAVLENEWINQLIVAYEPVAAIGSSPRGEVGGQAEDPKEAGQAKGEIKAKIPEVKAILYGGSVNMGNAKSYINGEFDGLLVGTESLDPKRFLEIIKRC